MISSFIQQISGQETPSCFSVWYLLPEIVEETSEQSWHFMIRFLQGFPDSFVVLSRIKRLLNEHILSKTRKMPSTCAYLHSRTFSQYFPHFNLIRYLFFQIMEKKYWDFLWVSAFLGRICNFQCGDREKIISPPFEVIFKTHHWFFKNHPW